MIQWYHACSFIFIYAMSVGGRRWSCRRTLGIHSLFHQPLFYSLQVAVQSYKHAGSSTQVNTETRQLEVMLTPEEHGKSMTIEWAAGWGGAVWGSNIWERAGREPPQSEGTAASTAALGQQLEEVPRIEVWLGVWNASMQMLMRLTDLCLYSDRDMSRHGVSIVCCTNSRCSVCSCLCP